MSEREDKEYLDRKIRDQNVLGWQLVVMSLVGGVTLYFTPKIGVMVLILGIGSLGFLIAGLYLIRFTGINRNIKIKNTFMKWLQELLQERHNKTK
jgi:hypothetical protein